MLISAITSRSGASVRGWPSKEGKATCRRLDENPNCTQVNQSYHLAREPDSFSTLGAPGCTTFFPAGCPCLGAAWSIGGLLLCPGSVFSLWGPTAYMGVSILLHQRPLIGPCPRAAVDKIGNAGTAIGLGNGDLMDGLVTGGPANDWRNRVCENSTKNLSRPHAKKILRRGLNALRIA